MEKETYSIRKSRAHTGKSRSRKKKSRPIEAYSGMSRLGKTIRPTPIRMLHGKNFHVITRTFKRPTPLFYYPCVT